MPQVLAIDVGFGNTKTVFGVKGTGDQEQYQELSFRSVAPPVLYEEAKGSGLGMLDRVVVTVDGHQYHVGPQATLEPGNRALDPDYIHKPEYRALMAGAWHYMFKHTGQITQSVHTLVLGLPVSVFKEKSAALKALALQPMVIPVPTELRQRYGKDFVEVRALNAMVLPQPAGAMMYAARLSDTGVSAARVNQDTVTLVIDPGYFTFDWFVARGMSPQMELCGAISGGVSKIFSRVSNKISAEHGVNALNLGRVEQGIQDGKINLATKVIDTLPYRQLVAQISQEIVDQFLQSFSPENIGVSRIVLAGGGAIYYLDALKKRLPTLPIDVLPDSVMSNARGFWLLANRQFQNSQPKNGDEAL
jgi:plasmid segregation protein ParM